MFCSSCGKTATDGAQFCPGCGKPLTQDGQQSYNQQPQQQYCGRKPISPYDRGGFWWGALGYITAGVISIVLYVIWKDEYPKRAHAILIGTIVGIVSSVVFAIIFVVIYVAILGFVFSNDGWLDTALSTLHSQILASKFYNG